MADLILKTRLDVLASNLRRVTEVLSDKAGSIEDLRAELKPLLQLPTDNEIIEPLNMIARWAAEGQAALRYGHDERVAFANLRAIEDAVSNITGYLGQVDATAKRIQARSPVLRDEGGSPLNALQDGLVGRATTQMNVLGGISTLLARAEAAERAGDAATAAELQKSAWNQYSSMVDGATNTVFCEYVDFLSGLALRDTGLDQGMCQIADKLLRDPSRLPSDVTWNSLTIPAQREMLQLTLAKIVRLGFPEWTIWALPLAVHEFGHVAVSKGTIGDFVLDRATDEEDRRRMRVCLADAFATHMMGPAYACAVILLRLDPSRAFAADDDRLTEKRARVVLAMLEDMDGRGDPTDRGRYGAIRSRLETEWDDALRQVGLSDSLNDQENQDIRDWVAKINETIGAFRALSPAVWPRVEALAGCLDPARVDGIKVRLEDELRIVLNAAWKRRLDENDLSRVNEVAEAAIRLWGIIEWVRKTGDQSSRQAGANYLDAAVPPRRAPLVDAVPRREYDQPLQSPSPGWASSPASKPGVPAGFDQRR